MCRRLINPSKYKVTINIENLDAGTSNVMLLNEGSIMRLFSGLDVQELGGTIEIEMLMEQDRHLQAFLLDLNISLANMNSLVFDTE